MKLCLVFPPQIIPTAAPLGIALLKSYVETNTKEKVKNLDLNLYFHNHVINNLLEGKFAPYNDKEKNKNSIELIKKSVEIFKKGDKDFFNPQVYNPCANEFLYLFEKIFNANKPLLNNFINNSLKSKISNSLRNSKGISGVPEKPKVFLRTYESSIRKKGDIGGALMPFTKEIIKEKPDFVGFSILTTEQVYYALALAKRLKQEIDTKVIIGGAAVRLFPEKFLRYGFIDFVINGDGEIALKELLEWKNKGDIKNIMYRKEGKIIRNNEENININDMPAPDFSDFNLDDYFSPKKVIPTLTSRGCYWKKCSFCADYGAVSMEYRVKDVNRLIDELRALKEKYNTNYFYFADEMISPLMFGKISEALMKEGLQIKYYTQARPRDFSLELLKKMKESGCTAIMWGVESACQRILDLINKGTNINEVGCILKQSHEAGIKNAVYAFGGFPTEKEEEYNQTIEWLKSNKEYIDLQFTGLFRLTKDSRIAKDISKFSVESIKEVGDQFDPNYEYDVKEGISQEKSLELFNKNYTFLLSLNKFSPFLGKFRDHMLVYFDNETNNKFMHDHKG